MAYRKNSARTRSYRLSLDRRNPSSATHSPINSSRVAPWQSASSDRLRVSRSLAVMTPVSLLTRHLPVRQQFEQIGEHLAAVLAVEGQGHLRGQQSVARADVVPPAGFFHRQVLLVPGQIRQGRGKRG